MQKPLENYFVLFLLHSLEKCINCDYVGSIISFLVTTGNVCLLLLTTFTRYY